MKTINNLNEIPVRTWSWLKVNETSISFPIDIKSTAPYEKGSFIAECTDNFKGFPKNYNAGEKIPEQIRCYIDENKNTSNYIHIHENEKLSKPLVKELVIPENGNSIIGETIIFAEENSSAEIYITFKGNGQRAEIYEVYAGKNSNLKLVLIDALDEGAVNLDYTAVHCDENANVNIIIVSAGSSKTISNCNIHLIGNESKAQIDSIYAGGKENIIDINYRVAHFGKNTVSNIVSKGSLSGKCRKVFRGTVDFISGCKGADGKEEESTILLSPSAKNLSVPLLLCGEDDVAGAHAASVGKLDEMSMFYLMSRGISQQEAKKIMVEAQVAPILEKLPFADMREEIIILIHNKLN